MDQTPRILVVDDNAANVKILQTRLAAQGYGILTAFDGEQALTVALAEPPLALAVMVAVPGATPLTGMATSDWPGENGSAAGTVATAGLEPTLTLVMDLDPAEAAKRRQGPPDRLERRGTEYFERVRKGFLREAERHPLTIAVIDAGADPDTVERAVQQAARRVIERIQESME